MIQDAGSGDALPLVAFVLRLMYDRLSKPDRTFRIKDYEAIGGVKGAVRRVAECALNSANLDPAQMAALKRALVPGLVDLGADGRYTGRSALFERLPQLSAACSRRAHRRALVDLRSGRLDDAPFGSLTTRSSKSGHSSRPAAENNDFLEARNRAERAADLWRNDGSDPTRLLPRGRSLAEASDILATHRDELSDPLWTSSAAPRRGRSTSSKRQSGNATGRRQTTSRQSGDDGRERSTLAFGLSKAALHLDGSAGARDTLLRLYREETFRKTVCRCSGVVRSVAFTGDDDSLLIGDDGGELLAVNWRNGRSNILWKAARGITSVAVSPDLSLVAVANGNEVQLLHPDGGLGPVLVGHQDGVTDSDLLSGFAGGAHRVGRQVRAPVDAFGRNGQEFSLGEATHLVGCVLAEWNACVAGDTVQMFLLDLEGEQRRQISAACKSFSEGSAVARRNEPLL